MPHSVGERMEQWERFARLFRGYEHAYGTFDIKRVSEKGKSEGKAVTIYGEITEDLWKGHLAGTRAGIGAVPLCEDNTCYFGVIDVDSYKINLEELSRRLIKDQIPMVVCRSKSGGAHLYMFFKESVEAEELREKLSTIASFLGYGGSEIFPKQSSRIDPQKDIGNWINLPYYQVDKCLRYAIHDGKICDLDTFLKVAEATALSKDQFENFKIEVPFDDPSDLFGDAPPCLKHLFAIGGFPEGSRNEGMYNVGVYLRKRYPDTWENKLQEYNVTVCKPPLSLSEINILAKSISKKTYDYRCKQPPIAQHCNRKSCVKQLYGVGESIGGGTMVEITHITKYEGDPVLWFVEIDGRRLMFLTEELQSQLMFNRICIEKLNRFPVTMPPARWAQFIDEKIRNADIVSTPEDASKEGIFWVLVEKFCHGKVQAIEEDEVLLDKPYKKDGKVYFRGYALFKFLQDKKFKYESEHHVWQWLRKKGADKEFKVIKGTGVNLWILQFEEKKPEPKKKVEKREDIQF